MSRHKNCFLDPTRLTTPTQMLSGIGVLASFETLTLVGGRGHSDYLLCAMKGHLLLVVRKHAVSAQLLRQANNHLSEKHNHRYGAALAPFPPSGNQCHDLAKFVDHNFPSLQRCPYLPCHLAIYSRTDFALQILDMDYLEKLPMTVGRQPISPKGFLQGQADS